MRGWRPLAVLLILVLTAGTSFAAGFRLPEAGVKAMGMGFAFTAQADDPSAIYFNPAGLTQLQGQNVMLGATYVRENGAEFTGSTPLTGGAVVNETQKSLNFVLPNAYYTYTTRDGGLAFGLGVFTPFGLAQEYESNSVFRNQVTKIELQTLVFNPTVAFAVNENLSLGFGIDYMWGNVKYNKTPVIPPALGGPGSFDTELDGNGEAWGYNFGLLLKASENLKIGFSYRSPFDLKVTGADFTATNPVGSVPALFPMGTTSASGTLHMPATAALGAAYTYGRLTVEADADWTFWHSYSQLQITNSTYPQYSSNAVKNWEDVCAFRIGAEYRVTDPLALRIGYAYDPSPAPGNTLGPELPDANRMNYTVGVGYKVGKLTIDAAFMYIDRFDRTASNANMNGTWTGDAWLAGLDLGYKF
jgi:long-chain fatty acid transport protein